MSRRKNYDKIFLGIVGILILMGIFILASASLGLLNRKGAGFLNVVSKQIVLGVGVGVILFLITSQISYKNWKKYATPIFIFSFFVTILVFQSYLGFRHGGARRWLSLGPISFQPSEFLKFGFIVYLASWISSHKKQITSFTYGFIPFLIITGFVALLLIMEPDLGTMGVVAITSLAMFFIGGGKLGHVAIAVFLGFALLGALIFIKPHAMSRMQVFLNPSSDTQGIGYQLNQSMIAVGSGGSFGRGFGMSIQKFNYLPEPIGDSIFAVFAEEFGFAGGLFLLAFFIIFTGRGLLISSRAPDSFAGLLASGIVILIISQSFINIASMVGLLPLTGLPLIFISQGGSAMAITLAEIGILLNISKYAKEKV